MRIKRYVVDSMPDALQRIRSDLGKDAVILNTKEVRSGGFLGLFSKKRIEVIAATDNTQPGASKYASSESVSGVASIRHPAGYARKSYSDAAAVAPAPVGTVNKEPALTGSPAADTPSVPVHTAAHQGKDDLVLHELRQMKEMVGRLSVLQKETQSQTPPVFRAVERRLAEQEVEPEIIGAIIAQALEQAETPMEKLTEDEAKQLVKQQLKAILRVGEARRITPETRIAHFVGPTGVGKTTTIAKLAAEQVLKFNRKVGFITSDTYRISAVEQLKTYATILNVPLEVVFSPQETNKAFERLADRDIIFMDTAGRNYRNEMYVSELNSLLQARESSETFLVLSLSSKYKDMRIITRNFSKFKLDQVLFTKMDETDSFGSIVNISHEFPLRLSYITTGQNVPDDIAPLNEDSIVDLILEEKPNE